MIILLRVALCSFFSLFSYRSMSIFKRKEILELFSSSFNSSDDDQVHNPAERKGGRGKGRVYPELVAFVDMQS